MPVPMPEQIIASICINPHNWKAWVEDFVANGKHKEAQEILDAVGTVAEDAINQVNVIAVKNNLDGYWL